MQKLELNNTEYEDIKTFFADVILPLPLPKTFIYRIPQAMNDQIIKGARVIVQFGQKKVLTGIVSNIHEQAPQKYQAKYILELLDTEPQVTLKQLELFEWISNYYMCHLGEVLNVALPSGLKISSQSKIQINPNASIHPDQLNEKENKLIQFLKNVDAVTYEEASEITETENIYKLINNLVAKDMIIVYEEFKERYSPKILKKIRLSHALKDIQVLEKLMDELEKYPKQADILTFYLQNISVMRNWALNETGLEKSIFTKNPKLSGSSLKTLLEKGVFEEFEIVVSRFPDFNTDGEKKLLLSPIQKKASNEVMEHFKTKNIALLHGVTGSGKTEIFIDLIQKVLQSGSQVLYLLPEIALTTQIVARLRVFFGSTMGIYHSKFSDNERVEVWQGILSGKYSFVVGVRSAVFLPFDNLGLIIVDEEHESSYKQQEPAPRYQARDIATVIAHQQHCKVLLASATPAIESYYQAKTGKYGLVQIKERYGEASMPLIKLADVKAERKAKTIKSHFTGALLKAIETSLENKEQVILFQNRRGYAPYITCKVCSWIPTCENCAVSLTYHLHSNELICHYCGYQESPPKSCNVCGATHLETVGLGTEKIEDELKLFFPNHHIQRMDLDTTRQKNSYQKIIQDFENRQIDILVGTQMISKGLDFDNVSLVGIFDMDRMLHFPDFRALEKAFQMMTQVSGRAGRKDKKGNVIIQTSDIEQNIFKKVIENDYESLYESEIEERYKFHYPPFTRLVKLTLKHPQKEIVEKAANVLSKKLAVKLGKARILGPQAPVIYKIRNLFLQNIIVKIERNQSNLQAIKDYIRQENAELVTQKEFKKLNITADVDAL